MDSKVAEVIKEITSASEFLDIQGRVGGDGLERVDKAMTQTISARIVALSRVDVHHATALSQVIARSSFSGNSAQLLNNAVRTLMSTSPAKESKGHTGQQTLTDVCSFLSRGDWAALNDPQILVSQKVYKVAERLNACGLHCPSELTYRHMAAAIASSHWPLCAPSGNERFHIVQSLKTWFTSASTFGTAAELTRFPAAPNVLDPDVFRHAYPEAEDPPVFHRPRRYHEEVHNAVMRRNNRQLTQGSAAELPMAPFGSAAASSMAASPWAMLMQLSQCLQHANGQPPHNDVATLGPGFWTPPRGGRSESTPQQLCLRGPETSSPTPATLPPPPESFQSPPPPASCQSPRLADVPAWSVDLGDTQRQLGNCVDLGSDVPSAAPVGEDSLHEEDDVHNDVFYTDLVRSSLLKRPAAAQALPKQATRKKELQVHTCRPSVPDDSSGTTWYREGKVLVSVAKQAYRVFRLRSDRVDKLVRWHDDKEAAWQRALDLIDGKA